MTNPASSVAVFGEALVDVFSDTVVPGGAPFNVARHLAGFGLSPVLITRIGSDAYGRRILDEMARFHMRTDGVQLDPYTATGQACVEPLPGGGHWFKILVDQAYDYIDIDRAVAAARAAQPQYLYFGTLVQRSALSRAAFLGVRDALSCPVFLDLNWRAGHVSDLVALASFEAADDVKLSAEELARLLQWTGRRSDFALAPPQLGAVCPAIAALMASGRGRLLVVTYGGDGYAAFSRDGSCFARGAAQPAVDVVDTVGAGDAFAAVTLVGRMLGWPLAETLERANAFAGAICGVLGAVPANCGFYARWREAWGLAPADAGAAQAPG